MRFHEIKHLIIKEARLDELKMSPSALEAFAKSDAAKGIQAGFEAELIFRGAAEEGGGESEPDLDQDTTIDSIDEMRSFFEDGDNSSRQIDRLVQAIEEDGWLDYFFEKQAEYVQENMDERIDGMFDDWFDDEVEDLVRNALEEAKEYSDKEIDLIIKAGLRQYDEKDWDSRETYDQMDHIFQDYKVDVAESARERYNEEHEDDVREELEDEFNQGEDVDFGDFLRERFGNRYASTIWEEYSHIISWPFYTENYEEGGFNEYAAENIASDLRNILGMEVTYSMGYHSARRKPNLWIIEPDSSLEPDDYSDMGAEIVSPPMPLDVCLEKMQTLFDWANDKRNGNAYANESTGFHMGVSLPITRGQVDFVKLALFLGDEHVLDSFGRSGNTYTEAAMKKIRKRVKGDTTRIDEAMKLMQHGLIELAERAVMGSKGDGFGKYTSINPKGAYIEFRSAGGEDYVQDFQKAKNTLLRYAQAMTVAANPAAERQEYYKKLYKLISPSGGNAAIDLFARYSSGNINAEELKKIWAEAALEKDAPGASKTGTWKVYDKATGQAVPGYQYSGYTEAEALALTKQSMSPASSWIDFEKMFDEKYELRDIAASTGKWAIIDRSTGKPLEVVDAEHRGTVADMALDKYASQGIEYYIEPVPVAAPKSKLSRRADLAQRIKSNKEKAAMAGKELYVIVDKTTGQQGEPYPADSLAGAQAYANKVARASGHAGNFSDKFTLMKKTENGLEPVAAPAPTSTQQQTLEPGQHWELYHLDANQPVYRCEHTNRVAAAEEARQWLLMNNRDIERYAIRAGSDAQQPNTQQHVPAQPQQVTTDAGIPMWELYDRISGSVMVRFPDHSQPVAWRTAQQWVIDSHATSEQASNYSLRPMMQGQ